MDEEEVPVLQGTAGWWLLDKTGLNESQKLALNTSLKGDLSLTVVAEELIRLFPEIHMRESSRHLSVGQRSSTSASRAPSAKNTLLKKRIFKRFKEANVTAAEEEFDCMSEHELEALAAELDSEECEPCDDEFDAMATIEEEVDEEPPQDLEALITQEANCLWRPCLCEENRQWPPLR